MPNCQASSANPVDLDVAPIGNGRIAALVNNRGRIVWWCFPRLDSDPVFSRLLAGDEEKGFSDVVLHGQVSARAQYVRNTAIVETILEDAAGNAVRVTDFAPRFKLFERAFHPAQIVRRIEPIKGLPRVTLRVRPTFNYGGPVENVAVGSNHIRFSGGTDVLRLTTDAPLSYIVHETPFALTQPVSLIFGPDEPLESAVDSVAREFYERTRRYWLNWVRGLGIPLDWQSAIIRAAITLKLCSFNETGAIIAAHTTSIPEAPHTPRTWDYRFCWLRDAAFVISALNRLGATKTMESYLNYITTIAMDVEPPLQPVYGIIPNQSLTERTAPDLSGYRGMGPVRVGNQAVEQTQHDAYGSVILGASHMFIDERLPGMGDEALFRRLEPLGHRAQRLYIEPDAGPWEYRGRQRIHTYSATMCWVACDRLARLAGLLSLEDRAGYWRATADKMRDDILQRAWSPKWGAIAGALDHDDLDASALLLADLGLLGADDERYRRTVEVIGRELSRNGFMMRYIAEDDFGAPETSFLVCQFWYADALASIGEVARARDIFSDVLSRANSFGVLSEDIHPTTGELWGNVPQTYCMAGIINTGMRLSRRWEAAWAAG
ncbi:glycoside hydrolase family 15 protein [Hyphomicrobium sulfonivorans]|uniref:glycoside hydrolase family 15 protein n=1 Tax=Hyphomicrobium sulfonivorans TaxID=121290 RepID=UPI001570ED9C|nr:glycoside hydrolase family 15 protein [Hyphomicrobium sulfonivorans]MBI1648386.1 glycoside hydrolase family 15 protein [Hyphomicrobium sulfonivorans]NSL71078.1 glucoamylase [Hyphomicrobium sulfonivorans]